MTDGLTGGRTEHRPPSRRTMLIVLTCVGIVIVAAGAAGRGSFRKGQSHEMALGVGAGVASAIIVVLAVGGLVALIISLLRAMRDEPDELSQEYQSATVPRWVVWVVLAVLAAFVGGVVWLVLHAKRHKFKPSTGLSGQTKSALTNKGHVSPATYHEWVVTVVVVLGITLLVVVGLIVWRRWLRRRWLHATPTAVATPEARDTATVLVEAMLEDLDAESDPRRAIIGAYRRMEGVLGQQDMGRQPSEAPLEWLGRVFDRLNLVGEPVSTLVHLFELAVFSQRPLGPSDRQHAIGALHQLSEGFAR